MSDAPWFDEAEKDIGLKEIRGNRHNPRVLEMFALSGHPWVKDDETAWCSAAVGAWMAQAGIVGTKSLAARSWLSWGKESPVKRGAIAIFKRGSSSWQGHVALCTGKETRTHVEVLGGNQANAVNIRMYPKSKLLGVRWPPTMSGSRTVKAQALTLASTVGGATAEAVQQIQPVVEQLSWLSTAKYVFIACVVISAVATIFFRWDDIQRKGR